VPTVSPSTPLSDTAFLATLKTLNLLPQISGAQVIDRSIKHEDVNAVKKEEEEETQIKREPVADDAVEPRQDTGVAIKQEESAEQMVAGMEEPGGREDQGVEVKEEPIDD
jgi:hypothetical protein